MSIDISDEQALEELKRPPPQGRRTFFGIKLAPTAGELNYWARNQLHFRNVLRKNYPAIVEEQERKYPLPDFIPDEGDLIIAEHLRSVERRKWYRKPNEYDRKAAEFLLRSDVRRKWYEDYTQRHK